MEDQNHVVETLFTEDHRKELDVDHLKQLLASNELGRGGTMIGEDIENIEVETIEKMTTDVKFIYLKIREQLQDPHHPLMIITKKFQNKFRSITDKEMYLIKKGN